MKPLHFVFVAIHMLGSTLAAHSLSAPSTGLHTSTLSENFAITDEDRLRESDSSYQRAAFIRPFADLAPRQKVMGIINAIGLLRTKISLMKEMQNAFEPHTGGTNTGRLLPGPALAYGDCRLGILGFEVCRNLGFLQSDPMVAPSSTQSKHLKLVGASSLVASMKSGALNIQDDKDVNEIMGSEIAVAATRALNACWNAQLLLPAFEARYVTPEQMNEAKNQADAFLFLSAIHAKHIIRTSRSSEDEDVASWLALIFADLRGAESSTVHSDESNASNLKEANPRRMAESVDGKWNRLAPSPQRADGLFGNVVGRFLPFGSQQGSQSPNVDLVSAPTSVFSALANSVGGIGSVVASTAQSAVQMISGDAASEDMEDIAALENTERRIEDILSRLPNEVNGQF